VKFRKATSISSQMLSLQPWLCPFCQGTIIRRNSYGAIMVQIWWTTGAQIL